MTIPKIEDYYDHPLPYQEYSKALEQYCDGVEKENEKLRELLKDIYDLPVGGIVKQTIEKALKQE